MDKLTVLNRALSATGNNLLTVLNDGTDEWIVANEAFGRAIDDLSSRHNWPFAKATETLVPAAAADNPSIKYSVAYLLVPDVIHVVRAYRAIATDTGNRPILFEDYEIIGRYLCCDFDTGISIEYVTMPDDANWHPQVAEILTTYVEAGCLRGLNEDFDEAAKREGKAEARLTEARPRVDRQNPVANAYNSSTRVGRYQRRGGAGA